MAHDNMKRFICLQAGHQNSKNNCDVSLRSGTGAPGEAEFTVRVRDAVSAKLQQKKNPDGSDAFAVKLVDATANCDPNIDADDFALFLAIHYDAYINGSIGGFTDFPEPSTDGATKESQRIAKAIASEYFKHSDIQEVNRSNANTRYYYMWKFLSSATPCVIIECGTGQNPHDKVILADTEIVANAIVRGICAAFGVAYDAVPVTPQPPVTPPTPPSGDYVSRKDFDALKASMVELNKSWETKFSELTKGISTVAKLAEDISNITEKLSNVKEQL